MNGSLNVAGQRCFYPNYFGRRPKCQAFFILMSQEAEETINILEAPGELFLPLASIPQFFHRKKGPKGFFPSFQPTSKQIAFMHVWPRHTILSILRKWIYIMPSPTISRPLKHLSCVNLEVSGIMKTGTPRCWLFLYLWPPHILHTPRFPPHPFSRYLTWWTEYRRESHSGNSPSSIKQKALVSIMEKRLSRAL